jgi:excisionase family DNA binding protein
MEEYLTSEEVAEILKVKPLTVREMFRTQRLRGFKIGKEWRTTRAMLDEDLDGMRRAAESGLPPAPKKKKESKKTEKLTVEAPAPETVEADAKPEKAKRRRKEKTADDAPPESDQPLLF